MAQRFSSFNEFWHFYLGEHQNPWTRRLHFIGLIAALGIIIYSLYSGRYEWLLAAPVLGYGLAWVGQFFIEKNRPATFQHPWMSLRGDLRMFWRMLFRRKLP
jgi:hypothetical protein